MAVAALPPGKKSPIDSMRSNFRGLKNNIKSMSKTVLGIQTALQKANELKRERLETLKENRLKQKDLRQKEAEEERLEKPNLSAFSNIKESIVKTGRNLFGSVLKIIGLFAGAWLFKNIDNIKDTVEKAIKKIQEVWKGIGDFVTGSIDVVKGIAKTVLAFGKNILEFDFTDQSGRLKEAFSDVELGWQKLSGAITGAEEVFENPENNKEIDKEFEGGESDDKDNRHVLKDSIKISINKKVQSNLDSLEDNDKKDSLFLKGSEVAKNSVFKNDIFIELVQNSSIGDSTFKILSALSEVPKELVPSMYWWATNKLWYLNTKPAIERINQRELLEVIMHRVISLEPNYDYGGAYRFFGVFYCRIPGVELSQSKTYFEKIKLYQNKIKKIS